MTSEATGIASGTEELLRATVDGMLDPHLLVEAVRDEGGHISDLRILVANQATLDYWGLPGERVRGVGMLDLFPGLRPAGLFDIWGEALESGEHVVINDHPYHNELLGELLYYDLRAARAPGDRLSISWRDVTARHREASTAEEVRRHYQLLAENASDIVVRGSSDGRLMWVSPSVSKVLGWDPHLLVGRKLTDLSHFLDRQKFRTAIEGLAHSDTSHVEVRLRTVGREHRWMSVALRSLLEQPDGAPAMFGTFRDIEDEMVARRSLADEQARFKAIRESSTDAIMSIDQTGTIIAWNRAATVIFGYEAAEAVGEPHTLVVPADFHGVVKRWLSDMSSPEVTAALARTHRAVLVRSDGTSFPCEYSVAVWDRDGEQHMTAIVRDVTEQQAILDDLQASQAELAEAQRLAGAGSWTYTPGTDEWRWSDELQHIYGVSKEDAFTLEDLIKPVTNGLGLMAAAERAITAGRESDLEYDVARTDGQIRRIQARIAPVYDARGELQRVRGTAVDVTDIHRAAEIRTRRTARHADYLSRVEHTLRTHLSVVEGWAGILESSFDQLEAGVRDDAIGAIKRNASALVTHVQGLMSESAQYAAAETIVLEPVDIAEVVAGAAADYRGLSNQTVVVEPTSGVWAMGAREAVDTVARHLIENAARHSPDGGCVEAVLGTRPGGHVEMAVRDDGPGIADGVILFTPFSKESRSSGHGLGLHVVRTLVEAMGGTVTGRNRTDGQGAEFIVTWQGLPD